MSLDASMPEWLSIRGARMERKFFEENVREARSYAWHSSVWSKEKDHTHCIVCTVSIPGKTDTPEQLYFMSRGGWLCEGCYKEFVREASA